jgi:hypothetical protein
VEDPCPLPARKLARNAQRGFGFYIGLAVGGLFGSTTTASPAWKKQTPAGRPIAACPERVDAGAGSRSQPVWPRTRQRNWSPNRHRCHARESIPPPTSRSPRTPPNTPTSHRVITPTISEPAAVGSGEVEKSSSRRVRSKRLASREICPHSAFRQRFIAPRPPRLERASRGGCRLPSGFPSPTCRCHRTS